MEEERSSLLYANVTVVNPVQLSSFCLLLNPGVIWELWDQASVASTKKK